MVKSLLYIFSLIKLLGFIYQAFGEMNFIFQFYIKTRCENFHMVVIYISFNIEGNKRFLEKATKV